MVPFKEKILKYGTPKPSLVADQTVYTFSFIVGNIVPKSVKGIHSATKSGMSQDRANQVLGPQRTPVPLN